MRRVAPLLARVDDALRACETSGDFRSYQQLERALAGHVPPWASEVFVDRLRALPDARLELPPVGQAVGVISLVESTEAALVLVRCIRLESMPGPAPRPPPGLRSDAVDALYEGAAVALRLMDEYDVQDPRRLFRFDVSQLDGEPLPSAAEVEGASLGLAALVATWSALIHHPVRVGRVFTGEILATPTDWNLVRAVGKLTAKRREASAAGSVLVAPAAALAEAPSSSEALGVETVERALEAAFEVRWDDPTRRQALTDPRTILWMLEADYWQAQQAWPRLAQRFERFAGRKELSVSFQAWALARAGACWTHVNAPEQAGELLARAESLLRSDHRFSRSEALDVVNHIAVYYRDGYRFEDAIARLEEELAREGTDRYAEATLHARSTLGQVQTCLGRCAEGLENVRAARDYHDERGTADCSRNHCYVVDALARGGNLEAARQEYALGTAHNTARNPDPSKRARNQAYLDYSFWSGEVRALRRAPDEASWRALLVKLERHPALGDASSWPRIGLERLSDAALLRSSRSPEEREAIRQAAMERARGQAQHPLFVWFRGQVSVEAALAELERAGDLEAARRWADEGLALLPSSKGARRFFAPHLVRFQAATGPAEVASALRALLDADQY